MQLKPAPLEIPDESPFKHDALGRRESAEILTGIIEDVDHAMVLAIDAGWGYGKTTFLDMWSKHLSQKGFAYLHFNAWETDFSEDPLVSFLGEMQEAVQCSVGDEVPTASKILQEAKEIATRIIKRAIPTAVKVATYGAVDLGADTERALADLIESAVRERLNSYNSDKVALQQFRAKLGMLIDVLKYKRDGKPLVFFIDELDRCRPPYAIELLERLKHLFSVPGIIFVLAIDKEQLCHSVRALYGSKMNAEGYLRRFIDLEYRLPDPGQGCFASFLFQKLQLGRYFELRKQGREEQDALLDTFSHVASVLGLSLRDQEACFVRLQIALRITPPSEEVVPPLLAVMLALRIADGDLYRRYLSGAATADEVINRFGMTAKGKWFLITKDGKAIDAYINCGRERRDQLSSRMQEITSFLNQGQGTEDERTRYSNWFDHSKELRKFPAGIIESVAKKVEIVERFLD